MFVIAGYSAAQNHPSVIGDGWGLDHIVFAVPSAEAVNEVFGARLGFSVRPGNRFPDSGLEQATVFLPPTYIELLWPYQNPTAAATTNDVQLRKKAASGGGPFGYNIDVSPVEEAAKAMRTLGLRVTLPTSKTVRTPDGKEAPGAWQFAQIDSEDKKAVAFGVPGGPGVGFLEYRENANRLAPDRLQRFRESLDKTVPDSRRVAGEINANTARKLLSIWISVADVAKAARQGELFGFADRGSLYIDGVGENGHAFQCGQGTLVFFQPVNPSSPLSVLVKESGYGPFGIGVAVADIKRAQQVVEQGTGRKFAIKEGDRTSGFVVPPELASGTFVEFVQQ